MSLKNLINDQNFFDQVLIGLNTLLISIWVLNETIALRNILLILGALTSLFYIFKIGKSQLHKIAISAGFSCLPLIFIIMLFLWMILHFLFFSMNPELQFKELRSTWIRSLLAWIMGITCAVVVIRAPKKLLYLGVGLMSNFFGLLIQYLPLAIAQQKLTNVMPVLSNYLQGKVYAVCLGLTFMGGLFGAISMSISKQLEITFTKWWTLLSLLCIGLILYSYVFIIDTRNGIALSFLLFLFWATWFIQYWIKKENKLRSLGKKYLQFGILVAITLFAFIYLHVKQNPGWSSTFEDTSIAFKIDTHHHWQNTAKYGYPKTESGNFPKSNTYERAAWFVAALSIIPERLLGDGSLEHAFGRAIKDRYPDSNLTTSHSAWLDFALSLGIPGITLLLGAYLLIFIQSFKKPGLLNHLVRWISLATILVYSVTELFNEAAFEWLIYVVGFLSSLLFFGKYREWLSYSLPNQ